MLRKITWVQKLDDWLHDPESSFNKGAKHKDKIHTKWPESHWLFRRIKFEVKE